MGLHSPRSFLAAARVMHAHRLQQDPGFTVDDVAQRLGYAQTKTLQLHARAYLGLTLGEMRDALDAQEALQRVAHGFAPQAARASASCTVAGSTSHVPRAPNPEPRFPVC